MAKVGIVLCRVQDRLPVPDSAVVSSETITSSASSQTSSNAVPASIPTGLYWEITSSGGDVWATFAASPTAIAGTTFIIPAGFPRYFAARALDKCAIIDA